MGKTSLHFLLFGLCFAIAACASHPSAPAKPAQTASTAPTPAPKATPAPAAPDNASAMTCKRGSDERKVEIEMLQPKGCKVFYSKWKKRQQIASSKIGPKHCEAVKEKVKKNLTAAKFECAE